jgi:hypothetical protein
MKRRLVFQWYGREGHQFGVVSFYHRHTADAHHYEQPILLSNLPSARSITEIPLHAMLVMRSEGF